jgi:hypothetical protein
LLESVRLMLEAVAPMSSRPRLFRLAATGTSINCLAAFGYAGILAGLEQIIEQTKGISVPGDVRRAAACCLPVSRDLKRAPACQR